MLYTPIFNDWELAIDCLEYAANKENEIPKLIEMVFDEINKNLPNSPLKIGVYNNHMRTKEEIMKDYGLEVENG